MAYNDSKTSGRGTGDDDVFRQGELNRVADDAFRKSAVAMDKAKLGETTKVFGIKIDAGLAAYISSIYNVATDYANKHLAPQIEKVSTAAVKEAGIYGRAQHIIPAAATFAGAVALKGGKDLSIIWGAHRDHLKERAKLAHVLAPVLDDIKGKHSVGTLYSVTEAENEVIYAHRRRMAKIEHGDNINNVTGLAINAGTNLLGDAQKMRAMWNGEKGHTFDMRQAQKEEEIKAAHKSGADGRFLAWTLVNTTTGQVADRLRQSSEYKLRSSLQPYTALEMIVELDKQVASNPKASSFAAPKTFQDPKKRPDSYPLEEYVMRIMIQHQKDMSDISPDHTEIRDALKEELAAVAKPIAKAIRNGDMSVMSLVRLVGEGQIIRNRGRAIARPEDVEVLVSKEAPKQVTYAQIDPKDYFKDVAFTRDELKTALKSLKGEERMIFASMLPDGVLEEAGVSKDEIKQIRETIGKKYEEHLAEMIAGLEGKSQDELQKHGLADNEVKELKKATSLVDEQGIKAVKELKTSPTNNRGIERLLSTVVVNSVTADREYLGTVMQSGRARLEGDSQESGEGHEFPKSLKKHMVERKSHASHEMADADVGHHARREKLRAERSHDSDMHRD